MSSQQTNINYELARLYADLSEAKEKHAKASRENKGKYEAIIRDLMTVIMEAEDARYGR